MIKKLQERSPLKYALVRNAPSLSPNTKATDKEVASQGLITSDRIYQSRSISGSTAVFHVFCGEATHQFAMFNYQKDRLDIFLGQYLQKNDKYKNMFTVCIYVFVLSHGQADVERGFDINKNSLVENLKQLALGSAK